MPRSRVTFREGVATLLVEDLNTDGRSKAKLCEALRTAGAVVDHTFVIFNYHIFPQTKDVVGDAGITLHARATWWDVLAACRETGHLDADALAEVERFLNKPVDWSAAHGGASSVAG